MKRYFVLAASIVINLCLGGIYAWSVFVPELVTDYGYSTTQTQIVFGTMICLFTSVTMLTGRMEGKIGPRPMILICALLIFAGYGIAGCSGRNFYILWLGYSIGTGLAIGFGYVTVLALSIRWFEKQKGLACGMVIAGYGCGAIMLSSIAQALINRQWEVMSIFKLLSVILGGLILISALIICNPPHYHRRKSTATIHYRQVFSSKRFYILALTSALGTFPGLMIIGNLKPMAISFGYGNSTGLLAIFMLAIGNTLGRIIGGFLHDRLKSATIQILLGMVAGTALLLAAGGVTSALMLGIIWLVGMSYGGMLANLPAQVAEEYGHENFGMVYPMILAAHGITALFAAPAGGLIYDRCHSYHAALILASIIGGISLLCFSLTYKKTSFVLPPSSLK